MTHTDRLHLVKSALSPELLSRALRSAESGRNAASAERFVTLMKAHPLKPATNELDAQVAHRGGQAVKFFLSLLKKPALGTGAGVPGPVQLGPKEPLMNVLRRAGGSAMDKAKGVLGEVKETVQDMTPIETGIAGAVGGIGAGSILSGGQKSASVLDDLKKLRSDVGEGLHLKQLNDTFADRVPASRDVLTGDSMAVPKGALRVAGGGLAGAAGGRAISEIFSPRLDDSTPYSDVKKVQSQHRRLALIGALIGAGVTGAKSYGPEIKAKLAL